MINFIQIGANIGNSPQDIIWPIVRNNNWTGVFVEPIPSAFAQLIENYKDLVGSYFENIAIMDYDGEVTIHYSDTYNGEISSANPNHSPRNSAQLVSPCKTIESLCQKYDLLDKPFELLQIDTEGLDGRILVCTDFARVLPRYIRFENLHLGHSGNMSLEETVTYLNKFGYVVTADIYNTLKADKIEADMNADTFLERKND